MLSQKTKLHKFEGELLTLINFKVRTFLLFYSFTYFAAICRRLLFALPQAKLTSNDEWESNSATDLQIKHNFVYIVHIIFNVTFNQVTR